MGDILLFFLMLAMIAGVIAGLTALVNGVDDHYPW